MKKVAVNGNSAGSQSKLYVAACASLALFGALGSAWAQEAVRPLDVAAAEARAESPLHMQVQTSTLPRLDAQDSGFQAPRVDVSLFPVRASGLGAVLGLSGVSSRPNPAFGLQPNRPSVDLGLRWSQRLQNQQIDITAWRRMNVDDDAYTLVQMRQPVYGARVEMNLSAGRKKGFATDLGFIGLQLEGGARISIKRKNGGPMVYYRTTF